MKIMLLIFELYFFITEREVHRKMFTDSHYTHLIKWEG